MDGLYMVKLNRILSDKVLAALPPRISPPSFQDSCPPPPPPPPHERYCSLPTVTALLVRRNARRCFRLWPHNSIDARTNEAAVVTNKAQPAVHHCKKCTLSLLDRRGSPGARNCAVCHDDLVEEVAVVPCGHSFHPE